MFLGKTQKEEIIALLDALLMGSNKHKHLNEIANDIEQKRAESDFLLQTDIDNQQVVIKVTDDIWIYSQQNSFRYDWSKHNDLDVEEYKTEIMDFNLLTLEEIEDDVCCYEDSLKKHKEIYGKDWKMIALECVFEQM